MRVVFTTIIEEEAIAYCDANPLQNLFIERTLWGRFNVLEV